MRKYKGVSYSVLLCVDGTMGQIEFQQRTRKAVDQAIDLYYKARKESAMNLYEVIVWDQRAATERANERLAATSEENAKFAVLRKVLEPEEDLDDLDIFIGLVGTLKKM